MPKVTIVRCNQFDDPIVVSGGSELYISLGSSVDGLLEISISRVDKNTQAVPIWESRLSSRDGNLEIYISEREV